MISICEGEEIPNGFPPTGKPLDLLRSDLPFVGNERRKCFSARSGSEDEPEVGEALEVTTTFRASEGGEESAQKVLKRSGKVLPSIYKC